VTSAQAVAFALWAALIAVAFIVYKVRARRRLRRETEVADRYAVLVGLKRCESESNEVLRARVRLIMSASTRALITPRNIRDFVDYQLELRGYGDAVVRLEQSSEDFTAKVILPLHIPARVKSEVQEAIRDHVHCGIWIDVV